MKPIWTVISLALLLTACKSTPLPPAKVEDANTNANKNASSATNTNNSADTNGIKTVDVDANASKNGLSELRDPNSILSKRQIYFDYNSDAIKSEYSKLIEAHAKYLQNHPEAKILLQGNTDERGTREYNLSLGQRRSVSVKSAMNLMSVSDKQIETVSYGEERAKQNCQDDGCFQADRRVDIVYEGE